MSGTKLFDIKELLVAGLSADLGVVQVSYGYPAEIENEACWFGNANTDSNIPVMRAGTKHYDEHVDVDCFLQVIQDDGQTQAQADTRLGEIYAAFQEYVAANPNLASVSALTIQSFRHTTGPLPNTEGHGSRFEITLHYDARITA